MHPQRHKAMIFTGLPHTIQKNTCVCFKCGSYYLCLMFPGSHVGTVKIHPLCCVHDLSGFYHVLTGHHFSRTKCVDISCCSCWVAFLNMKAEGCSAALIIFVAFFWNFLFYLYSFWEKGDQTVFGTHYSRWSWMMVFCSSTVMFSGLFAICVLILSNIWLAILTAIKHQVDIFIGLPIITPDLSPKE